MEYRLQIMYNHMVGRAESVISPFYFILLGLSMYIGVYIEKAPPHWYFLYIFIFLIDHANLVRLIFTSANTNNNSRI